MLQFLLKWLITDQLELGKNKGTQSVFNIFNAVTLFKLNTTKMTNNNEKGN